MSKTEVTLPAMGEGIIEATITRWFFREGESVLEDEPLLEVATDKVDSEIPSPVSGIISRIFYSEGEIPRVGAVIAIIESELSATSDDSETEGSDMKLTVNKPETKNNISDEPETEPGKNFKKSSDQREDNRVSREHMHLTPFVKFLAKSREISFDELMQIKGTGLKGRITKADLNAYILAGRPFKDLFNSTQDHNLVEGEIAGTNEKNLYKAGPGEELIEMNRTRKLIAEHMVRSKRISPHVTSMVEIDVSHMVQWRNENKETFQKKHGIKLTYTPVIVYAAVQALKKYPMINISVYDEYIIKKKNINIGVATALPDGNLIVPVIKDADKRTFWNLARELSDLAKRAREGKLEPAEIKGGTFTITNMGQYDNISGTPIINQPEVAILAVGSVKKKPGVVTMGEEHTIGVRDIMVLSLTYDHRVVDGALGGSFVKEIGKILEGPMPEY
ncbi:MAG: 2-oxo acid dehydrogenase subunit E2 [Bacteroidales bacterium]|nr:2-oxo acid dehydrogenase subunit E2 [Bacteroidales bacterium]